MNWKGGRDNCSGSQGRYVRIICKTHPYRDKRNRYYEHRYMMEQKLGRILDPKEVVHHINGIPSDNRIENLELLSDQSHHNNLSRKQSSILCPECNSPYTNKDGHSTREHKQLYRCRDCNKKFRLLSQ